MECHYGCYYQTCLTCGRKDGNSDSEKDDSDNMHDSDELNSMQASLVGDSSLFSSHKKPTTDVARYGPTWLHQRGGVLGHVEADLAHNS